MSRLNLVIWGKFYGVVHGWQADFQIATRGLYQCYNSAKIPIATATLRDDPLSTGMFYVFFGEAKYHVCVVQSTPTDLMTPTPPCRWADHDLHLSIHIMMS